MPRYNPNTIEPKWQRFWEENHTFKTPEMPAGEKLYVLDMFPYPSGDGLHVGHPEGYTATDIVCRFARMRGKSVLHPMGFDAFGLPAEEHAIKTGEHPRIQTEKNIDVFRRQLKSLGFSYDWDRELATTDVDYFKWTQFIFLVLFDTWFDPESQKGRPISELPIPDDVTAGGTDAVREYQDEHRLAFQSHAPVNWCPELGTVLANEEVIDGKSERGGHPVVRMPLRQWMLRITAYADRLEKDLADLDWSEGIKLLQRNWIGRSTGAEVDFYIALPIAGGQRPAPSQEDFEAWKASRKTSGYPRKPADDVLRIYTTRPDTLFGATYMVIAPEHPFVDRLMTEEQADAVRTYCEAAARKSDRERQEEGKKKTGVFTGSYAINPVNGEAIPIWIADYVLISYGTGAIMAVPAHDERDMEFAKTFDIPIRMVVAEENFDSCDPEFRELRASNYGSKEYAYLIHLPASPKRSKDDIFSATARAGAKKSDIDLVQRKDGAFDLMVRQFPRVDEVDYWLGAPSDIATLGEAYTGNGIAVNSTDEYNGLTTPEFKQKISDDLTKAGLGRAAVNYKLRDWLFSRQRFWGEPFPILHELNDNGEPTGAVRAVDAKDLPVDLPHLEDFKPAERRPPAPREKEPIAERRPPAPREGLHLAERDDYVPEPPLGKAPADWLYVTIDGKRYKRETNTMPQWAGSCWYYLRFIDPKNDQALVDPAKEKAWMPIDLYVGGAEHAVLHLLYARFWHKVLYDRGYVSTPEPFQKLVNQGMILGENNEKMSKSRGNVVNPDDVVRDYGADSLRMYEMFMGPLEATKPWSMDGVRGVAKFLDRAWRMIIDSGAEDIALHAAVQEVEPTVEQNRVLHKTIGAVTRDIESMSFNTAIARLMEFTNFFTRESVRPKTCLEQFVLLLSPYAPHIAEELWAALGHADSLAYEPWPKFDAELAKDESIEIPVQIKGKVRSKIQVSPEATAEQLKQAALADPRIQELLADKQIVKEIVVPGRLVNFVVK